EHVRQVLLQAESRMVGADGDAHPPESREVSLSYPSLRVAVVADPVLTVTPWLLTRADDLCPVRLRRTAVGDERSHDPVNRARLRDAFVAAAREAHAELRAPDADAFASAGFGLEPEERAVLAQGAHWYAVTFGGRPAVERAAGAEGPTLLPR